MIERRDFWLYCFSWWVQNWRKTHDDVWHIRCQRAIKFPKFWQWLAHGLNVQRSCIKYAYDSQLECVQISCRSSCFKVCSFAFIFSLSSCFVSLLCAPQMTSTETLGSFVCVSTFKCKRKENRHKVIWVETLDVSNTNMDRSKVTLEMRIHLECRSWRKIIFQTNACTAIVIPNRRKSLVFHQRMWILVIEPFVGVPYGVQKFYQLYLSQTEFAQDFANE